MCLAMLYCDVITNLRWRTAVNLKITKSSYRSEKSSILMTFCTTAGNETNDSHLTKNCNFLNSRWWRPQSFKSAFNHNLSIDYLISAKFCMTKHNGMLISAVWPKLQIFKIEHSGWLLFCKLLNRHISLKNCLILLKLGILHQILQLMTPWWPKVEIFKIQDSGSRHLENWFFGRNSSTNC